MAKLLARVADAPLPDPRQPWLRPWSENACRCDARHGQDCPSDAFQAGPGRGGGESFETALMIQSGQGHARRGRAALLSGHGPESELGDRIRGA